MRRHSLEMQDGFADDSGAPNPDMPTTTMRMILTEAAGVTQMVITSTFPSLEAMEQMIEHGHGGGPAGGHGPDGRHPRRLTPLMHRVGSSTVRSVVPGGRDGP